MLPRVQVLVGAALLPLLPCTAVYSANHYDAGSAGRLFERPFVDEQHAVSESYYSTNCLASRRASSTVAISSMEQGPAEPVDEIDVAAVELDLSSGALDHEAEGYNPVETFYCPDTAALPGALTSAGLVNSLVTLGVITVQKARSACSALARENGLRKDAQDGAPFRFSRPLAKGQAGPDVRELQRFLNAHGFVVSKDGDGAPGNETDVFGPRTVEAVKRYQRTYAAEILHPEGLSEPSGVFGRSSMRKANRLLEERRQLMR